MEPNKLTKFEISQVLKVNGIPSHFPYDKDKITEKIVSFDDKSDFILPHNELT